MVGFATGPIIEYVQSLLQATAAEKALEESQDAYSKSAIEVATSVTSVRAAFD